MPEQMTIAMACYPFCASQMTVKSAASAIRLDGGIDVENDARNFLPVSIVRFGVEKSHVRNGVLLVIRR
jgi:hypothetical protein